MGAILGTSGLPLAGGQPIVSPPALSTLTLALLTSTAGAAYSGTFTGKTSGSTIAATSSDGTVLTVTDAAVSGTFSAAGSPTISWTETLSGAIGSPKVGSATMVVGAASTDPLEQLAVGTAGTGAYAGHTVAYVQPFNGTLDELLITPANPDGIMANNFSERDRRHTSTTSVGFIADQYCTGFEDANDGVFVSSYSDILDVSGGSLIMRARYSTTEERALQGTRSSASGPVWTTRRMSWGTPTLMAMGAVHGNRIEEFRFRIDCVNKFGSAGNPSVGLWSLDVRGGSEAGSSAGARGYNNEQDFYELHIGGGSATTRLAAGGGETTAYPAAAKAAMEGGSFVILRAVHTDTEIQYSLWTDDWTQIGTTITNDNSAANNAALFWWMAGAFNTTSGFDETKWTGGEIMTQEVSAYRVLIPTASLAKAPLVNNPSPTVLEIGGTGSVVIPPQATVWGQAVANERVQFHSATNTYGPGRQNEDPAPAETYDALPTGVTWNSGTRTISFDATFSPRPGVIHGYMFADDPAIGWVEPYKFAVYVRPKMALPSIPNASLPIPDAVWSYVLPRGSDATVPNRYWHNGNCPHGTHSGLTMTSGPAWLSFDPVTHTFSGTCPSGFVSASVTMRCTNGAGIYAEQTFTLDKQVSIVVQDDFTGTNGASVTTSTPEIGGAWTAHPAYASPSALISTNSIYAANTNAVFFVNTLPSSPNVYVTTVANWKSSLAADVVGVAARMNATLDTMYVFRFSRTAGAYQILSLKGGTAATQVTSAANTFTSGSKVLRLEVENSGPDVLLRGYVDGVLVASATDIAANSPITAAGYFGFRGTTAQASSTGIHMGSIEGGLL